MGGFSHGRGGKIVFAAHDDMLFKQVAAKLHLIQKPLHG
jgi:hypothetical protein